MDQSTDTGDEEAHRDRQRIDQQAGVDAEIARRNPFEQGLYEESFAMVLGYEANEDCCRCEETYSHRTESKPTGEGFT